MGWPSRALVSLFALAFIFSGCVTLTELKLAQDLEQKSQIEEAYRQYAKALEKDPGNKQALQGLQRLGDIICSNAKAEAKEIAGSAEYPTIARTEKALAVIQNANPYDPGGKRLSAEKEHYEKLLFEIKHNNSLLAREIREAIAKQKFQTVPAKIKRIRDTDPRSTAATTLEKEYYLAYGDHLEQLIIESIQYGNLSQANALLATWDKLVLSAERRTIFKERFAALIQDRLRQDVWALMGKFQYYKAFLLLKNSGYQSDLDDLANEIRNRAGEFYLNQIRLRLDKGEVSRAYLEAVKGYEIDPNLPGMFELYRDTRDKIFGNMQKYVAIPAFGAPKDNPDLGPQFSDALISYLFRMLPYGINIVERERIDLLLEEQKRELKTVASLLNVDLIISGNVSLLDVERQNTEHMVTVKAKVGEKTILNPEFEAWQRLPESTRASTTPPAKMLALPTYQNFTYKKGRTSVKGYASVSLRIFDTKRGSITYAQEFNAHYAVSDDYQDEVQLAGVKGDPRELPADNEVREKLRNKIISQIAQIVNKQFEKREHGFLQEAKYYLSRREKNQALDMLAQGFLYCVKSKVKLTDPDFSKIRDNIIQLTEVDFIEETAPLAVEN